MIDYNRAILILENYFDIKARYPWITFELYVFSMKVLFLIFQLNNGKYHEIKGRKAAKKVLRDSKGRKFTLSGKRIER